MYEKLMKELKNCAEEYGSCNGCSRKGKVFCVEEIMREAYEAINFLSVSSPVMSLADDVTPETIRSALGGIEVDADFMAEIGIGGGDYCYVFDLSNKLVFEILKSYLNDQTTNKIEPHHFGKKVLVNFWDSGVSCAGTREEMKVKFEEYLDGIFGPENK